MDYVAFVAELARVGWAAGRALITWFATWPTEIWVVAALLAGLFIAYEWVEWGMSNWSIGTAMMWIAIIFVIFVFFIFLL